MGSFKLYRKFDSGSLTIERHTVYVSDDTGRIAMLEKRTIGDPADDHDTQETLTRYIYSNHLQSASLELDEHAAIISYEEYHPYGTTSFQSNNADVHANAKRYRYTGKERDEESGLYYHGARYYIPWLGRWTACDPLESKYAGMSPYNYCENNPVMLVDPSGMGGEKTDTVSDRKSGTGTASGYMEYSDGTPVNFFATQEETVIVANSVGKDIRDNPLKYSEYGLTHPFEAGFYSGVGEFLEDTVIGIGSFVEHPGASMDAMTQTLGTLGAYHLGGLSAVKGLSGGMETLASMSMSIDNSWNNFKNGDAYTKANYAGYASAFVASFFIPGGGEAKVAEAAGELADVANAASKVDNLTVLAETSVTTTRPGSLVYMKPSDPFVKNIANTPLIDDVLDVVAHGTPNSVQVSNITVGGGDISVNHRVFARLIENHVGSDGSIRLLSCSTGKCPTGFAQNLANKMNLSISAPNEVLWAWPGGRLGVFPINAARQPVLKFPGEFINFKPLKK